MISRDIRAVLADDEPLARVNLKSLLAPLPGWTLVGEAGSGPEACQVISETEPDVVFLDIRMPGLTGLEVAERLIESDSSPLVVFATAFDEHALEAFAVEAADYLLKPFDRERFNTAVRRLEGRLLQRRKARELSLLGVNSTTAEALDSQTSPPPSFVRGPTLAVKSVGKVRLVDVDEIQWIGAAGNYVRLYLGDTCLLHRATLASLQEKLDPARFLRIHRSTLVRKDQVVEIRNSIVGRSQIVLRDGTELEVSQRFRQKVIASLLPQS